MTYYLKVSRSRLPNKKFSIAKMAIAERKLDVFDCHKIDFAFKAIENENLLNKYVHDCRLSGVNYITALC